MIKKTFKVRHKILKILGTHDKAFQPKDDLVKRSLHFDEISSALSKFDRGFILDNLDYLRLNNEIYCSMQFDQSVFCILSNGNHALSDRKYIQAGIKERLDFVFDLAKTVSTVVLLAIAIWTFIQNLHQTNENKIAIEKLKDQVSELKSITSRQSRSE